MGVVYSGPAVAYNPYLYGGYYYVPGYYYVFSKADKTTFEKGDVEQKTLIAMKYMTSDELRKYREFLTQNGNQLPSDLGQALQKESTRATQQRIAANNHYWHNQETFM